MEVFNALWVYVVPFLIILTVVVFVHELGHYAVARWSGVRVEVFSIGFGPEIMGWDDARGTRWKISWVPLGGYVKFFGDANAASAAGAETGEMSAPERAVSFHYKRLDQRAAIVSAGPIANLAFAVVVYAILFSTFGQPYSPPVVHHVVAGSAAEEAGFQPGDRIVEIDGASVRRFQEVQQIVRLSPQLGLSFVVLRNGERVLLRVTPRLTEFTDNIGRRHQVGMLGVSRDGAVEVVRHDPLDAVFLATRETGRVISLTLGYVGQVIIGARSGGEIGGPIGIARISGEVFQISAAAVLSFVAVLSISLGLINLFPIPLARRRPSAVLRDRGGTWAAPWRAIAGVRISNRPGLTAFAHGVCDVE